MYKLFHSSHSPTTMKIEPLDKTSKMEKPMTPVNRESATLPKVKTSLENHNSHKSFSKMLILAQVFGFLPAQGILGPDFRSLHFTWKSARVGYTVLTILGATFISGMQLYKIFAKGLDLMEANRFFFNFSGVIAGCLFLNLARNWPVLMKDWGTVELSMLSYGWPAGLNRKLNILLVVFVTMALSKTNSPNWFLFHVNVLSVEYILVQSNKLVLSLECNNSTADAFTYFFGNMSYSHIFTLLDYDVIKGIVLQLINFQLTFIWTYNDLFVMLISTALACRFSQITARIQSVADAKVDQITPETTNLSFFADRHWNHLEKLARGLQQALQTLQKSRRSDLLHSSSNVCFRLILYLGPTLQQFKTDEKRFGAIVLLLVLRSANPSNSLLVFVWC